MKIEYEVLRNKILGCWNGKNIGGVLGGPYEECPRTTHDVTFYSQDIKGNPPANDDLDLQLVWLNAVEQYGDKVNSHILADYWMSYIYPNWSEYGMAKRNLRAGVMPPLSGYISNRYKDSNGSFIRTEIWACLAAGNPELAVRYAYEDAIVDHADEGVYATVFCAAVESAAFVESDKRNLIEIGLSFIPEYSMVAKAVKLVIDAFESGVDYLEARKILFEKYPGTFGLSYVNPEKLTDGLPNGEPGMDAPNAIGIIIIGWLYGNDDFGRSLCIAVNCGEDADCTAATLGAIFGIIQGNDALPEKWVKPLDGVINTCCIDLATMIPIPENVDSLTDRVIACIPKFLDRKMVDLTGIGVSVFSSDKLMNSNKYEYVPHITGHKKSKKIPVKDLVTMSPFCVRYNLGTVEAIIDYIDEPFVNAGEIKKVKLIMWDNNKYTTPGEWVNVSIYSNDGVSVVNGKCLSAPLNSTYLTKTVFDIELNIESINSPAIDVIFDITVCGRQSGGQIKATFYAGKHKVV